MTRLEQCLGAAVVLLPVLCCLVLARQRVPGRAAAVLAGCTVVVAVLWDRHKAPYEGPAIWTLAEGRGLTVVDLVVPVAVASAGAVLWRRHRAPRGTA